jgi:hypothetical protein
VVVFGPFERDLEKWPGFGRLVSYLVSMFK